MTATARVPFKFLDPYTRDDRDLFFGREREVEEIHSRLLACGLLLVYGVSGCGKTSLVQCGLASKFEPADCLAITVRRGTDILASLLSALEREALTPAPAGAPLDKRVRSLYLDHFKPIHLIFDQFEEVFIFGDRGERRVFAEALKGLAGLGKDLRLIFVVREEYLGAMTEFEPVLPRLFESRIRIERMDRFRAREAIEGPCGRCGVVIEPGLPDAILDRLAPAEAMVELTWLQVVMDRLYRQAAGDSPESPALTQAGLAALGPLDNVLGRFLEVQLIALPNPLAGEAVLKAMVSGDGTRRPMTLTAIAETATVRALSLTGDELQSLIQRLISARILTDRDAHGCYELRHDSLAQNVWDGMTAREKELEDLRQAIAARYRDYQKRGLLLDAGILRILPAFENGLLLPTEHAEFVEASRQAVTRRRQQLMRQQQQQIRAFLGLGGMLVVVSGIAIFAFEFARQAEAQRALAEQHQKAAVTEFAEKAVATARRLADADPSNSTHRADLAHVLLLRASVRSGLDNLGPAAEDYSECARLVPDRADCQGNLGWILIRLARFGEARPPTEEAHRLAPDNSTFTVNLGHTYLLEGDTATAQRYYDEAVAQVPDADAFEKGPVADFELFIAKGWQPEASRAALARMREAFARCGDAKAETRTPTASPPSGDPQ